MGIKILKLHMKVLSYLFLWPKDYLNKAQNEILSIGYFVLSVIFAIPVVWAAGYQLSVGVQDVNILVEALIAVCDIIGYLVVFICLLKNQQNVGQIIEDINIFLKFCDASLIQKVDEDCMIYTIYLLIYVTTGLIFNVGWPLFSSKQCVLSRGSEFYLKHDPCGMPTQNWYPFDASQPQVFWIVYVVEANYCFHICYAFSLATATVIGLLMHIIAQLKNCGKLFEEIFNENDKPNENEQRFNKKFVMCVKYHQAILEYSERVFKVFSHMLVIYVTMTSFTLAVISYQIAMSQSNIQDRLRYTLLLIGWVLLFFLICFYAQKVKDESMNIANSAYNSNWYDVNASPEIRKKLMLVIARAQKPLILKVKYMGTISLVRFVSVLKTAYSFFTLLLTVTDDD